MKAEELRVGNYVIDLFAKSTGFDNYIIIVSDLSDRQEIGARNVTGGNASIIREMIGGLPLTEEWLTKAGFKPWGKYDYLWKKGRNHACTIIQEEEFKGGKEWFELRGVKNWHVIIEYVHQLQNLYFALTGEELKFKL